MMQPRSLRATLFGTVAAAMVLAGCASEKTLYQWEKYQPQVYEYFKNGPSEAQVTALEAGLQKIQATGAVVPPGYHAHLGMLYLALGKDDQMVQQFQTEKAMFPESAAYMDFLLRNVKTGSSK